MTGELDALALAHWHRGWQQGYADAIDGRAARPAFNDALVWVGGYDQAWTEGYGEGHAAGQAELDA